MNELYDKVIASQNDENLFAAAARNWLEAGGDNPFAPDTEAHNLYFNACMAYKTWQAGAINARVSKRRMVNYVRQIAELNLPNPYVVKKQKRIIAEPETVVLGVVPDKKKKHRFFKGEEE